MDPLVPGGVPPGHEWSHDVIMSLIAALGGGGLTKLIDRWFGHRSVLQSRLSELENRLHAQMMEETKTLRDEIAKLRNELDEWKRRYFDLLEKKGELEVALKAAQRDLEDCEDHRANGGSSGSGSKHRPVSGGEGEDPDG